MCSGSTNMTLGSGQRMVHSTETVMSTMSTPLSHAKSEKDQNLSKVFSNGQRVIRALNGVYCGA